MAVEDRFFIGGSDRFFSLDKLSKTLELAEDFTQACRNFRGIPDRILGPNPCT